MGELLTVYFVEEGLSPDYEVLQLLGRHVSFSKTFILHPFSAVGRNVRPLAHPGMEALRHVTEEPPPPIGPLCLALGGWKQGFWFRIPKNKNVNTFYGAQQCYR